METIQNISNRSFTLEYQVCANGPKGLVVLPAGTYNTIDIRQYHFSRPAYVQVKQKDWDDAVEVNLKSVYNLL